jgi:hypothetical protein
MRSRGDTINLSRKNTGGEMAHERLTLLLRMVEEMRNSPLRYSSSPSILSMILSSISWAVRVN